MKRMWLLLAVGFGLLFCGSDGLAQTTLDYDAAVHQGNAQLQAGNNDLALATANSAIKMNADRWEAYALAGGALMNLKRYEEAADDFSKAIDRAPEAKQAGLRDLRKKCFVVDTGASAPKPAAPASQPTNATTTQAEVVLWKSIENSITAADFRSYLKQYPNGAFAVLAQRHLDDLDSPRAIQNLVNKCGELVNARNRVVNVQPSGNAKEDAAYTKAAQMKDPQQQIQALRDFLVKYPNSTYRIAVLTVLLIREFNSKSFDFAITDANSILTIDSSNLRALNLGAYSYLQKYVVETDPVKKQEFIDMGSALLLRCTQGGI